MARPKTIPAIEPNAGLQADLGRRIDKLLRAQAEAVVAELFEDLADGGELMTPEGAPGALAQDAKLSLKAVKKALRDFVAINPERAISKLDAKLAELQARAMIYMGQEAKTVSQWFVRAAAQNVTASQRRALIRAGVAPKLLRKKLSVPLLKHQYISPRAAKAIPGLVDDMTGLITRMASDDLTRLREVIVEGLAKRQSIGAIEDTLRASRGFTAARAKRVALDQSIKINQGVQRANAHDLGIKTAVWVHVPGQYSSRKTHMAFNGKRFNVNKGLFDSDVGEYTLPGVLPFCRCICRYDIDELLE